MAILIQAGLRDAAAPLLEASYQLRHRILVQRLGWALPSGQQRHEIDQFDGGDTCHLLSCTPDGRVRGTMRLTPSLSANLTCDVLQSYIPVQVPRAAQTVECSRLCVDLDLPASERHAVRADLFLSQLEACERFGWTHTTGVLLQSVLQYFIRSGLVVDMLSPPLKFTDCAEASFAFMLESGPSALTTARRVLRREHALQDPAAEPSVLRPAHIDQVA